ncbi:MAG: hypothetical protein KGD57_03255 [Candidatus Lokiarchaeota archaeon]|nr:hypothetical protein [Candidatus Lokiarchaeota archaeon]
MSSKPDTEKIIYVLALVGSIIAIFEAAIGLARIDISNLDSSFVFHIVAIIIALLALLSIVKPDDPIPYNWIVLFIFSILLIIFRSFAGGIIMLVASILGLLIETEVI